MLSLTDRLDILEADLSSDPPGFILNDDLPFAIFRYDPRNSKEGEWAVRREVEKLKTRVENQSGRSVEMISLADLFWRSIDESEGVTELIQLEHDHGFKAAQEQVNSYLSDPDWRPLPQLLAEATDGMDADATYLFLTRAGVFAPAAYRVSALLEQVKGRVNVPTVLFYPGTWSGTLNYLGLRSNEDPMGSYRVKIYGREQ